MHVRMDYSTEARLRDGVESNVRTRNGQEEDRLTTEQFLWQMRDGLAMGLIPSPVRTPRTGVCPERSRRRGLGLGLGASRKDAKNAKESTRARATMLKHEAAHR